MAKIILCIIVLSGALFWGSVVQARGSTIAVATPDWSDGCSIIAAQFSNSVAEPTEITVLFINKKNLQNVTNPGFEPPIRHWVYSNSPLGIEKKQYHKFDGFLPPLRL